MMWLLCECHVACRRMGGGQWHTQCVSDPQGMEHAHAVLCCLLLACQGGNASHSMSSHASDRGGSSVPSSSVQYVPTNKPRSLGLLLVRDTSLHASRPRYAAGRTTQNMHFFHSVAVVALLNSGPLRFARFLKRCALVAAVLLSAAVACCLLVVALAVVAAVAVVVVVVAVAAVVSVVSASPERTRFIRAVVADDAMVCSGASVWVCCTAFCGFCVVGYGCKHLLTTNTCDKNHITIG